MSKKFSDFKANPLQAKTKKIATKKNNHETGIVNKDISGTLSNGTLYEASFENDGYNIYFDPFLAKKDEIFSSASAQIIAKLYNDQLKDQSHISIETDIDYAIFTGIKARYKIIPIKESHGEISSISISPI